MNDSPIHPSPPHPDARRELLATLRTLERNPEGDTKSRQRLQAWLSNPHAADAGKHLNIQQLKSLARRREQEGRDFQLPEHLHSCGICMDLFQVVRQDLQESLTPTRENGRTASADTRPQAPKPAAAPKFNRRYRWLTAAAAILLLILASSALLHPPTLIIETGVLQHKGQTVTANRLPGNQRIDILQPTRLVSLDGSSISIAPNSRIRIGKSLNLRSTFHLLNGRLEVLLTPESPPLHFRAGTLNLRPASARFILSHQDSTSSVEVLQGTVQVITPETETTLTAGMTQSFLSDL